MKKYLIYIIQALFPVLFLLAWLYAPSGNCSAKDSFKKIILTGKVLDRFIDSKSHSYPTLQISNYNKKLVIHEYDKSGFYDFVEIGDSLIKEKGSLDIRLIRNELDTVFTIDYGCEK